jgi:outer membrane protein TolC
LAVPLIAAHAWTQTWHAEDNRESAKASAADVRRQLALATARAYLAIVTQKNLLSATTSARDTARAHYEFAHARFAGGIGTRLDEVRAEDEYQTDVALLASGWAGLARAQEALGVLAAADGPLDAQAEPPLPETPALDDALSGAASRSDVRAAESRQRAANHQVRDAWADYLPYLYGAFQPFYQNPPTLVQPLTGWQAQLILSVPIYDGGLRYGLQRERKAAADEARTAVEGALRQARADVRTAFEEMRRADESLAAAQKASVLTHQALDLANLAYKSGAATNLEVTDAQRSARDADDQVALAEDTARQARLDLLSASGRFP